MSKLQTAGAERSPVVVCYNSPVVTSGVPSHTVCRSSVTALTDAATLLTGVGVTLAVDETDVLRAPASTVVIAAIKLPVEL